MKAVKTIILAMVVAVVAGVAGAYYFHLLKVVPLPDVVDPRLRLGPVLPEDQTPRVIVQPHQPDAAAQTP